MFPGATDSTTEIVTKILITTVVSKTISLRENN